MDDQNNLRLNEEGDRGGGALVIEDDRSTVGSCFFATVVHCKSPLRTPGQPGAKCLRNSRELEDPRDILEILCTLEGGHRYLLQVL